jgi:alkylation response protein AidB-like acyl-CoA dehydrogenase/putative sterol carrier protein
MRSVYFGEEHELFRRSVRQFVESEVAPHADAWEASRRIPRSIWRRMGEEGLLGILFPASLGGSGATLFHALAFLEELPRSRMGGFCAAVSVQQFIATGALFRRGSEALKERYLVPSIAGRKVGAIAISEPDTGSDVAAIRTTAVRDGDGWVVDGAKTWITNGVFGDFYVVAVKTDRDAGAGGISLIAMDSDLPGIRTNRLRKMGWHCSDTAEIVFDSVRVPAAGLIGRENRGFYYIMETFAVERLVTAAIGIGSSVLALEETRKYMESRMAFGRPLTKFQALRHRMADLSTELEAARQLVYHTAWLLESGESAIRESAMSKLLATELNKRLVDECLQFFGGFGYVEEYPMERFFRDARVSTIVAGTSEIMREIVGKTDLDGVVFGAVEDDGEEPTALARRAASEGPGLSPETPPAPPSPSAPPGQDSPASVTAPEGLEGFFRSLPARVRPEKTAGWKSRFHFRFEGSAHPEWTVVLDGGSVTVTEGLEGSARCVVQSSEKVYLDIETGRQNPETAFLMGKVKVSDLGEMMRYVKAFRPVNR